jgi:hypothetical protein
MAAARLLWIEVKRNPVPWLLPVIALLVAYDTYRTAGGWPPVWTMRANIVDSRLVFDFAAFTAGLSAWTGSREGRRRTGELLEPTARATVTRHLAALSATLLWVLPAYAAGVAAVYIQTARVATWGGPPLWPVALGAVEMITICVLGFTGGVLFPGRFTAPLAAIVAGVLPLVGNHDPVRPADVHDLLGLDSSIPPYDLGVFYHVLPDVSIARAMFTGGIAVAALGLLALAPVFRSRRGGSWAGASSGRWLRAVPAVLVVVAGVAASWAAYDLIGTAKPTATGWNIPALHDAANDRPVPYRPDCTGTTFLVCIHPAFSGYLDGVATALAPVAAEVAGLPGAPVRAELAPNTLAPPFYFDRVNAATRVYEYNVGLDWDSPAGTHDPRGDSEVQQNFLDAVIGGPNWETSGNLGDAPQAVVNGLMAVVGSPSQAAFNGYQLSPQVAAAAKRFAALSPAARHAWLAGHLPALQSGQVTLAEIP